MRIIGIDPGYERCGVAILDRDENGAETLLDSHCFTTDKELPFEERLVAIIRDFRTWVEKYRPDLCALERLYFTTNKKTAMRVAEVRGALIYSTCDMGLTLQEYGPNEIKVAITGDGRATKQQMILMVPQLVSVTKDIKYDDEYDAIATALTASALSRNILTNH